MRRTSFSPRRLLALAAGALLAALPLALAAQAQGGPLTLEWWAIDSGGALALPADRYTLSGSIGQPEAAPSARSGSLTLEGGFWEWQAPAAVHLPLAVASVAPAPDLVVEAITLAPSRSSVQAGEPVEVLVTVANRGTAPAAPFWVDLYVNPSAPPDAANQIWYTRCGIAPCVGAAWGVKEGLAAGARITLSTRATSPDYTRWPGWLPAGTTALYAYADSWNAASDYGAVRERDEGNNQGALLGLTVGGVSPPLSGAAQRMPEARSLP